MEGKYTVMQNISALSDKDKREIAEYLRVENIENVNALTPPVKIRNTFYMKHGKRWIDFIIALFAVIITSPINVLLAIVTFINLGMPIIFRQKRTGKDREVFIIYKFRNMTNSKDAAGQLLPPEKRVTKWGEFMRKTSLDELLNFVSVLKGDMSLVGPRPLLDDYQYLYSNYHMYRFAVRPGLECPKLEKIDHVMDWQERLDNDVWYVQNCSLLTDIKLVLRIVQAIFDRKATKIRGKATAGRFLGYDKDGSVISSHNVPDEICEMFCRNHGFQTIEEAINLRQL